MHHCVLVPFVNMAQEYETAYEHLSIHLPHLLMLYRESIRGSVGQKARETLDGVIVYINICNCIFPPQMKYLKSITY